MILSCFLLQENHRCFIGLKNLCVPMNVSACSYSISRLQPTSALELSSNPKPGVAIPGILIFLAGVTLCPGKHWSSSSPFKCEQSGNATTWDSENTDCFWLCCSVYLEDPSPKSPHVWHHVIIQIQPKFAPLREAFPEYSVAVQGVWFVYLWEGLKSGSCSAHQGFHRWNALNS